MMAEGGGMGRMSGSGRAAVRLCQGNTQLKAFIYFITGPPFNRTRPIFGFVPDVEATSYDSVLY